MTEEKEKKKRETVMVRFQNRYGSYNEGESASFDPAQAKALVKSGVAVFPGQPEGQPAGAETKEVKDDKRRGR